MTRPIDTNCALCHELRPLENSHIIPEFMYEALYDDKHRFHVLTTRTEARNTTKQKGIREHLLCACCERKLSKYERYGSLLFNGGTPPTYRREGDVLVVSGIDYLQFKLLQLSILWRASICTLPFFAEVQLGPHQERIRKLLLSGNPGAFDLYPCLMWGLQLEFGKPLALMIPPKKHRTDGKTHFVFVFGSFLWNFHVSNQPLSAPWSRLPIQEDGTAIIQVKHVSELPGVDEFVSELVRLGRHPNLRLLEPKDESPQE